MGIERKRATPRVTGAGMTCGRASRALLATGAASAMILAASSAAAQIDVNPPIPNVLLLLDTSGSMENMIDGSHPEDAPANTCVPGTTTALNRWATAVSVLTGTITNFSCQKVPRDATFATEYGLLGQPPYDLGYYLPFHRILSNGCAIGPGTLPPSWDYWNWPATPFNQHDFSNVSTACSSPFAQTNDGLLDTYRDRVRFGLMTFDTLPDPSTGISSGTSMDQHGAELGMWSYFPGWASGTAGYAQGNPPDCSPLPGVGNPYEVGARNPAAPPWEGPLIPFGPPDDTLVNVEQTNDHIQQAILAMRPYGATPIAGMLTDAQYFLLNDPTINATTNLAFGPKDDPYFKGGCRKTFIILLTDGQPNMDMRPGCAAQPPGASPPGHCPYDLPENVAYNLATNPLQNLRVPTYVIGFGLAASAGVDCTTLTSLQTAQDANGNFTANPCATATGSLKACCTLNAIAYNGGTSKAFFADNITGLRSQLSVVLSQISSGSTARTYPVFATASVATAEDPSAGTGGRGAIGFQFLSSFNAPAGAALWSGNLERERYVCQTVSGVLGAQLQTVDPTKGDDFALNVNTPDPANPRRFFTFLEQKDASNKIWSPRSQRPNVTTDDGLGLTVGAPVALSDTTTFISALSLAPEALGIDTAAPPATCASTLLATTGPLCATRLMNWELGVSNSPTLDTSPTIPAPSRNPANCPTGQVCSLLGSIYHSTPAVVSPPHDFLQDESYASYAQGPAGTRPTMLYTGTTDGQLHAFKVSAGATTDTNKVDSLSNNELWSFFPPAVLQGLLSTYNQQSLLLDGPPVVKDVIYERTRAEALVGFGSGSAAWSTVLVGGGGTAGGYYYAIDVTDPTTPRFLWQLSSDSTGSPLFGDTVPQPAIATVTLNDGTGVKEVAVAILAGGSTALKAGTCARQQTTWPRLNLNGVYQIRGSVRCWGPSSSTTPGPARSVTIVRLDNGQVLMNFRGNALDGPASVLPALQQVVKLDSPLTGIPVAFPSQTGQIADHAYVGDADGTLWRIDFSNPDPTQWTVDLAWDAYSLVTQAGDTATTGEPIQTPPIVSIDTVGNPVVLFSTGDQELFTTATPVTRVWSLTEKPTTSGYQMNYNWVVPFTGGKRVTGPISLFNAVAYFATFTPNASASAACTDGYGSVWGVDYTLADPSTHYPTGEYVADPVNAPTVKVAECANPAPGTCSLSPSPDGSVVFGVGVTQTPTCADTTTYPDPYLGAATASIGNVGGGNFQLVFETGKGGSASDGSKTNSVTQTLPTPRVSTRIDSWASVVE